MNIMNNTNTTTPPIQSDGCILTDAQIRSSYNLALRIVSVFVLLVVSFLGASFSVASSRVKFLRVNPIIINTGKFFGSGVVLATGFVHILPDAMATLTDPCLPDSWNVYGAYAGLFAMLAALGMQLMEFLAHQRYRSAIPKQAHITTNHDMKELTETGHMSHKIEESLCTDHVHHNIDKSEKKTQANGIIHDTEHVEEINDKTKEFGSVEQINETLETLKKKTVNHEMNNSEDMEQSNDKTKEPEEIQQAIDATGKQCTHHHHEESEHVDEAHNHAEIPEKKDVIAIEIIHLEPVPADICEESAHHHHHGLAFQNNGEQNKISTYLLEFGIAVHSVLIGLTLGTTTESFVALFIALCFHQFFEAIALGAQIATLTTAPIKSVMSMVIFFSLTTPTGVAIGIGIHAGTYNPKSVTTLLVTGILDSLSAGILIYVALVNLITADMGTNAHTFYSLSRRLKLLYFTALYLGVAAMAVIGRWA